MSESARNANFPKIKKLTPDQLEAMIEAAKRDMSAPISNLPEGWKQSNSLTDLDDTIADMAEGFKLAHRGELPNHSPEEIDAIANKVAKKIVYEALIGPDKAVKKPRTTITSTKGSYKGKVTVANDPKTGKRLATDAEINHILNKLDETADKFKLPGANGTRVSEMPVLITVRGQESPLAMLRGAAEKGTLGYASAYLGITYLVDHMRDAQSKSDAGHFIHGADGGHFSVDTTGDPQGVINHTIYHEIGHMVHFGFIEDSILEAKFKDNKRNKTHQKVSGYGDKNAYENFAENFAKYMTTGEASPDFLDTLEKYGMLVGTEPQKTRIRLGNE